MPRFFEDVVDLNWWLEAIERHSGANIKSLSTWGYKEQCKDVYFYDPEYDKKYGYNMKDGDTGYSHRLYIELDRGYANGSSEAEKEFSIKNLYELEHNDRVVIEVTPQFGYKTWSVLCRKKIEGEENVDQK